MEKTKTENIEVNNEAEVNNEVEVSKETVAASAATGKEHKDKKEHKKKYTVEEILSQQEKLEVFDERGRQKKIKVKVKTGKLKKRESRNGYLFTSPYIVGVLAFFMYPFVMSIVYTFFNVYYHATAGKQMEYNGVGYYKRVFDKQTDLLLNLGELSIKLLMAVPLIVVFALLMSMMLNMKIKGKGIFRTIYFLPVIIVSGPVMSLINSDSSSIQAVDLSLIQNALTSLLPMWLANGVSFIFSNILLMLWYSGVQILIFLAALQKIDTSLYEAAKIDGGSGWECFWKITMPTIRPMLLLNALYTVVFLSQDSLISPIINDIATVMENNNEGYGYTSTFSLIYSVVIIIFVLIVLLMFRTKKDVYDKQVKKTKKLEKKTRKHLAKHQKQLIKNQAKLEKALEKQKKAEAEGKSLREENFDE